MIIDKSNIDLFINGTEMGCSGIGVITSSHKYIKIK